MDHMSNFRPEFHVAQQSRRDKLRIHHDSNPPHHHHHQNLGIYVNNLEQLPDAHDALNYESPDIRNSQTGNICYDPSQFCPEMLNFNPSATVVSSDDPQYFSSTWKSIGSQPSSSDWLANQSPIFVGEGLSCSGSSLKIINSSTTPMSSTLDVRPYNLGYHHQELHSSLNNNNPSGEISLNYQNALQELVTSSNVRSFGDLEFASLRQKSTGELLLLPAYADQLRLESRSGLISRPIEGCHDWSGALDYAAANKNNHIDNRDLRIVANDNSKTLSLSLSSVPSPKVHATQIADRDMATDSHSRDLCTSENVEQDSRTWKPEYSSSNRDLLNLDARQDMIRAQALTHRNLGPGPLGPFTGYATILRSSRFLRPAQQLLDDLCCIARSKHVEICDLSDKVFEEVRVSCEITNAEPVGKAIDSRGSSFALIGTSDNKCREPLGTSCSTDSYWPENLQKKAKLMYMQDEICKRYKQYHQQMQMVVSSFESVAGLNAATPYVTLALKMVSKHFRCLKNAIMDQLKSIRNALGEELLSSPSSAAGASFSKGGGDVASVSMLKFFDHHSFQKQKGDNGSLGVLDSHHVWRPQRGLPERAVSILRAWLFDHFLHPYPTDTDKHMLATQTGLTRNQVSNWFINARVRVWKPMVEEIHMLETKGVAEAGGGSNIAGKSTNGQTTTNEGCDQANESSIQSLNRLRMSAIADKKQVECSSEHEANRSNANLWNQEKRSRIEYQVPSGVDGSLVGLVPSHHRSRDDMGGPHGVGMRGAHKVEMGGLGAVSLTLGLRQSAENSQRPPEHHLRTHFGGHIIRDFVG